MEGTEEENEEEGEKAGKGALAREGR